jgi:hypothetical protein
MAGEQDLLDRWNDVYHNSAEYTSALKSDAVTRSDRDAQARAAIQQALGTGNGAKATQLQQQLLGSQVRERTGTGGGHRAGLDAFQRQRVTDYIDQARNRGNREFARVMSNPVEVGNGPGYYAQLQDHDFSNDFPYATFSSSGPGVRGHGSAPAAAPATAAPATNRYGVSTEMVAANRPTQSMLDNIAQDAELAAQRRTRTAQKLRTSLPKDLLDTFETSIDPKRSPNPMTPKEQAAFFDAPPELQYSQLRQRQVAGKPPAAKTQDYLSDFGTSRTSGVPTITRPLTVGRPSAALADAPEYDVNSDLL